MRGFGRVGRTSAPGASEVWRETVIWGSRGLWGQNMQVEVSRHRAGLGMRRPGFRSERELLSVQSPPLSLSFPVFTLLVDGWVYMRAPG